MCCNCSSYCRGFIISVVVEGMSIWPLMIFSASQKKMKTKKPPVWVVLIFQELHLHDCSKSLSASSSLGSIGEKCVPSTSW